MKRAYLIAVALLLISSPLASPALRGSRAQLAPSGSLAGSTWSGSIAGGGTGTFSFAVGNDGTIFGSGEYDAQFTAVAGCTVTGSSWTEKFDISGQVDLSTGEATLTIGATSSSPSSITATCPYVDASGQSELPISNPLGVEFTNVIGDQVFIGITGSQTLPLSAGATVDYYNEGTGCCSSINYYPSKDAYIGQLTGTTVTLTFEEVQANGALSVSCVPQAVAITGKVTCTAIETGNTAGGVPIPPTGEVLFTPPDILFAPSDSCELSPTQDGTAGACSVSFTADIVGPIGVEVDYYGDSTYDPNVASTTVYVVPGEVSASCADSMIQVGGSTVCTVVVAGNSPTGAVRWADGTASGSGFGECQLAPSSSTVSTCEVRYSGDAAGTYQIVAGYYGDQNNEGGDSPPFTITVSDQTTTTEGTPPQGGTVGGGVPTATTTILSCAGSVTLEAGTPSGCTADVSPNVPGLVSWSSPQPGTFQPQVCPTVDGSCSTVFTQAETGRVIVNATFRPSDGADYLASSAVSIIANLSKGSPTVFDETGYTGVNVTLSGSPDRQASVESTLLGDSIPPGTGIGAVVTLSDGEYFDVKVTESYGGTATVCLPYSGAGSDSRMEYYSKGGWLSAADVHVSDTGQVCGNIPGSALTGTFVIVGNFVLSGGPAELEDGLYVAIGVILVLIVAGSVRGSRTWRRRMP